MEIVKYANEMHMEEWDRFVMQDAVNGTFLHTRRFLSYHPKERFVDGSFLIKDGERILAVCPANVGIADDKKILISHQGSTYGGLVIGAKYYKAEKLFYIINKAEAYLKEQDFNKVVYKITPDIFSKERTDLIRFCLRYAGYKEKQELGFFINFETYGKKIVDNFNKERKRCVKSGLKMGLYEKDFFSDIEIKEFHDLLCRSLTKYGVQPVHSYDELLMLRDMLKKEIKFRGIYLDGKIVAGTMLFCFDKTQCMHTQYLAGEPELAKISPISCLYYSVIKFAMDSGCKYLSWGIATDHKGTLNMGLTHAKESVGSSHIVYSIFEKEL